MITKNIFGLVYESKRSHNKKSPFKICLGCGGDRGGSFLQNLKYPFFILVSVYHALSPAKRKKKKSKLKSIMLTK